MLGKGTFKDGDHISLGNICANKMYLSVRRPLGTFTLFSNYLLISQRPLISILFSARGWKCSDLALAEGSHVNNGEFKKDIIFRYCFETEHLGDVLKNV